MPGHEILSSDAIETDLLKVAEDLHKEAGARDLAKALVLAFVSLVGSGAAAQGSKGTPYEVVQRAESPNYDNAEVYTLRQGNTLITTLCPTVLDGAKFADIQAEFNQYEKKHPNVTLDSPIPKTPETGKFLWGMHEIDQLAKDVPAAGAFFQHGFSCDMDVGETHKLLLRGKNTLFLSDNSGAVVPLQIVSEKKTK